jgi:hypothetical protein
LFAHARQQRREGPIVPLGFDSPPGAGAAKARACLAQLTRQTFVAKGLPGRSLIRGTAADRRAVSLPRSAAVGATDQRLLMYRLISKPRRRSSKLGVDHFMVVLLVFCLDWVGNKAEACFRFFGTTRFTDHHHKRCMHSLCHVAEGPPAPARPRPPCMRAGRRSFACVTVMCHSVTPRGSGRDSRASCRPARRSSPQGCASRPH